MTYQKSLPSFNLTNCLNVILEFHFWVKIISLISLSIESWRFKILYPSFNLPDSLTVRQEFHFLVNSYFIIHWNLSFDLPDSLTVRLDFYFRVELYPTPWRSPFRRYTHVDRGCLSWRRTPPRRDSACWSAGRGAVFLDQSERPEGTARAASDRQHSRGMSKLCRGGQKENMLQKISFHSISSLPFHS